MPITFISSAAHTKRLTAQWSFKHSAVMAALLMACCSAQAQNDEPSIKANSPIII